MKTTGFGTGKVSALSIFYINLYKYISCLTFYTDLQHVAYFYIHLLLSLPLFKSKTGWSWKSKTCCFGLWANSAKLILKRIVDIGTNRSTDYKRFSLEIFRRELQRQHETPWFNLSSLHRITSSALDAAQVNEPLNLNDTTLVFVNNKCIFYCIAASRIFNYWISLFIHIYQNSLYVFNSLALHYSGWSALW